MTDEFDWQSTYYLDAEGELLVQELAALRDEAKEVKAREAAVRAEILERLAGRTRALTADGRPAASVTVTYRRNIDRARLEAMYPEVFNDVVSEAEVTTLKIDL